MNKSKRNLDCIATEIKEKINKTNMYLHLWKLIDCSSSMHQMSANFSSTFQSFSLLPLVLLLLLLSEQFQTWEISSSRLRGVAGWNQFHWIGDCKHIPTQHFWSVLVEETRGTCENLWCSLQDCCFPAWFNPSLFVLEKIYSRLENNG